MTDEQKDLLFKDLCARLPYNTKVQLTEYSELTGEKLPSEIRILDYYMIGKVQAYCKGFRKDEVKPYLFPMSSMTEEQLSYIHFNTKFNIDRFGTITPKIDEDDLPIYVDMEDWISLYNWLNKNHFDYNGLIPLGLALDATGLGIYR